jgi:putative protein-disulfide isomerase
MNSTELWFVFDPLCGWCYAAHPALASLQAGCEIPLRFFPSGIFAGANGRPMTAEFRDYAWDHDQHIQQLTGQAFTDVYYRQVLSDFSRPLDSAAATLAFQVLYQQAPERGVELLHRIQALRYVHGQDITSPEVLAGLAAEFGMARADFLAAFAPGSTAVTELQAVLGTTQGLMQQLRLRGVPDLILHGLQGNVLVPTALLYRDGAELAAWIKARL